ncbi:response regulator [Desulfovibrio sp. OttesenSCG-928-C06]|nr:response regulator [Desulfovibrio sp. OttesenSCG-928-C06]
MPNMPYCFPGETPEWAAHSAPKAVVLAVDDDPGIVNSIMSILRPEFTVRPFTSGFEAIKYLGENQADLILLDYHMPQLTGSELLDMLLQDARTSKIPVIFLTGSGNEQNEVEVLQKGAMDYILKPVNARTLLARVRLQLELKCYRHHLEQLVEARSKDLIYAYNKLKLREEICLGLLARVTDMRDHETGDHISRTTEFTSLIVKYLLEDMRTGYELTQTQADDIIMSVKLHDIGKIAVPDQILQKQGPLTAEEFTVVKLHPEHGARLLDEFIERMGEDSFLNTARDIILSHHEKWDGSGYPEGLAGEAIPLSARITAIADVYDALTTVRPYKKAFSHEQSMKIIQESSGQHFDPYLVSIFGKLERQFNNIAQSMK